MININELSIGNIILGSKNGTPTIVRRINDKSVGVDGYKGSKPAIISRSSDFIYPIPLTPLILEGTFDDLLEEISSDGDRTYTIELFDDNGEFNGNYLLCFRWDEENECLYLDYYGDEGYELARIDYVHQLQNIFFSLRGEELQVDEYQLKWRYKH